MNVTLLKIGEVHGSIVLPSALLSDSNPFDCEISAIFGDEDLESGDIALKPENSDNLNVNLSYTKNFGKNAIFVGGLFNHRKK